MDTADLIVKTSRGTSNYGLFLAEDASRSQPGFSKENKTRRHQVATGTDRRRPDLSLESAPGLEQAGIFGLFCSRAYCTYLSVFADSGGTATALLSSDKNETLQGKNFSW